MTSTTWSAARVIGSSEAAAREDFDLVVAACRRCVPREPPSEEIVVGAATVVAPDVTDEACVDDPRALCLRVTAERRRGERAVACVVRACVCEAVPRRVVLVRLRIGVVRCEVLPEETGAEAWLLVKSFFEVPLVTGVLAFVVA